MDLLELIDTTPTAELPIDELRWRVVAAIRDGRIGDDLRPVMLGFLGGCKRPGGPSVKQIGLARQLIQEIRRYERDDDAPLIDKDDAPDSEPSAFVKEVTKDLRAHVTDPGLRDFLDEMYWEF